MTSRVNTGGAGRVIAGTARGIRLSAPGAMTRPFSDRVKQTLFAILDPDVRAARVLDLFAGSGAAGIEALSRGAEIALFIERDATAAAAIRENLERTRLGEGGTRVIQAEALGWLGTNGASADGPFGVVILDPPYDQPALLQEALELIGASPSLLASGAVVVAKHFSRGVPPERTGLLASSRTRRFGDTALTFYRVVEPMEEPS